MLQPSPSIGRTADGVLDPAAFLLDSDDAGHFAFDTRCRFTEWSSSLERMFGLPRSSVLGRSAFDLFPFLRDNGEESRFQEALAGRPVRSEGGPFPVPRARGGQGWYQARYAPVRDGHGVVVGGVGLFRDVTVLRRSEERLQESELRFRTLADSAPVLIWMAGVDGRCLYFNEVWLRFTGRSMEQETGYGWAEGLHFEDFQPTVDGYMEAFKARKPFRLEYRLRRADGAFRWILDQGTPRYGPSGEFAGYIGSCIDVTDLKDAAVSLRKSKDNLERVVAERTAELSRSNADLEQFATVVAHDLREPLRSVAACMQHIAGQAAPLPDGARFARMALAATGRMERLVAKLLDYARVGGDAIQPEPANANAAVDQAVANLRLAVEESDAVVRHDPLPVVHADPLLLVQLFQNLILNGIKFRGDGRPEVHIAAHREEGAWVFSVRDNGIGIDPRHHDLVFRIFSRLRPPDTPEGEGVGLAICKKIVERHGGRIGLDSAPGAGTTFHFSLPDEAPAHTREA